ncbi:MAG: DUF1801 domain-containing protein [Prolixibacteraceae bacterium]|nr:DUF1801 domain-containing protein [Prolixibacteraceae bacterium]
MENEIDQYIGRFSPEIQDMLKKVRASIRKAAPEAIEAFKYQMPTYVLEGNLVHFAANKQHLGFYPAPSGLSAFSEEISAYKNSKGAVQFPYNREIPYALIEKIVRFRVEENKQLALKRQAKSK